MRYAEDINFQLNMSGHSLSHIVQKLDISGNHAEKSLTGIRNRVGVSLLDFYWLRHDIRIRNNRGDGAAPPR